MDDVSPASPPPPAVQRSSATNGLAVAALVIGIVSLCLGPFGIVGGIAAVVMGVIGKGKADRAEAGGGGLAIAGIVTGGLAVLLGIVVTLTVGSLFAAFGGDIVECSDPGLSQIEQQQCIEERLEESFEEN